MGLDFSFDLSLIPLRHCYLPQVDAPVRLHSLSLLAVSGSVGWVSNCL
jgi:hypothetical protein